MRVPRLFSQARVVATAALAVRHDAGAFDQSVPELAARVLRASDALSAPPVLQNFSASRISKSRFLRDLIIQ